MATGLSHLAAECQGIDADDLTVQQNMLTGSKVIAVFLRDTSVSPLPLSLMCYEENYHNAMAHTT